MKKLVTSLSLIALMCSLQVTLAQDAEKSADKKAKAETKKVEELKPRFWIFMGLPGGDKETADYTEAVDKIYDSANERFGIAEEDIHVLFGKGILKEDSADKKNPTDEDYRYKPCNKKTLHAALADIVKKSEDGRPNFIIFMGHATPRDAGDANFNIAGPDIRASEIGKALKNAKRTTPMGIIVSTPISQRFFRHLRLRRSRKAGQKGCRAVIAACEKDEKVNWMEPEFSLILPELLDEAESDLNGDGYLTWTEIFEGMQTRVDKFFETENYVQTEWPVLDGDANGRGTLAPGRSDKEGGNRLKLKIHE